jgi:dTDP-4-dehydrorhamnose reductase
MRVLVLGGMGMLGHKLAQVLTSVGEVIVTIRSGSECWPSSIPVADVVGHVDVLDTPALPRLLDAHSPDAVVNAVGLIKQIMKSHEPEHAIAVNAIYPQLLARFCGDRGMRLIHYSTDCIFSGSASSARGPNGYRESDVADARDLYGMTKLLGEPPRPALVLRTSIIGPELRGHHGLVEWFLSQGAGPVRGFTRALFTGLPTLHLAAVTATILRDHRDLQGVWHVAADAIDKCSLLNLIKTSYGRATVIEPHADFYCDRRLDGGRFAEVTGWKVPAWPELIETMRRDQLDYEA